MRQLIRVQVPAWAPIHQTDAPIACPAIGVFIAQRGDVLAPQVPPAASTVETWSPPSTMPRGGG